MEFKCNVCGQNFNNAGEMASHMVNYHTNAQQSSSSNQPGGYNPLTGQGEGEDPHSYNPLTGQGT